MLYVKEDPFSETSNTKAVRINWNETQGVYGNLAKRIYATRNSLVHNKSNYSNTYNPYEDMEELKKEIAFLKSISELVFIEFNELI